MDESLDRAPCGFFSVRDDATIIAVNETLAEILNIRKEELLTMRIEAIFTTATKVFYNTHLFPLLKLHNKANEILITLRGRGVVDVPVLLNSKRRNDGEKFVNDFVVIPVFQRQKYENEILTAKRNAENAIKENQYLGTLLKTLESKTQEADEKNTRLSSINKDLIQFGKIVSHDMEEALHKLNVFTDKLSVEDVGTISARGRRTIEKIVNTLDRLKKLIRGLGDYIQLNQPFVPDSIDIKATINDALSRATSETGFKDIQLTVSDLPAITGHETQLQSLFFELISNSIAYRKPNVPLEISIEGILIKENLFRGIEKYKYADHVKIIFSDNGLGFDNKLNEYVFSLFKKAHQDTNGLGMGLSVAKKIVENHSGSIVAESQVGVGTRVIITLPLLTEPQQ